MNRNEFMRRLEILLSDISKEERDEALQYYRDYFEDAGAEHEAEVIRELESPEKVAETIKADLKREFQDVQEPPKTSNGLKILLIVLIVLIGAPIILPAGLLSVGSGLLIFVVGLIGTAATVKLCMGMYPAMFQILVNICRWPFYHKAKTEV